MQPRAADSGQPTATGIRTERGSNSMRSHWPASIPPVISASRGRTSPFMFHEGLHACDGEFLGRARGRLGDKLIENAQRSRGSSFIIILGGAREFTHPTI